MSNSQLSVLIQRQAEKYGDRVALKYRDYDTETICRNGNNDFQCTS